MNKSFKTFLLNILYACIIPNVRVRGFSQRSLQEASVVQQDGRLSQFAMNCTKASPCRDEEKFGNRAYTASTSRGYFPEGCRWRMLSVDGYSQEQYEFWDEKNSEWILNIPLACKPKLEDIPGNYSWPSHERWVFKAQAPGPATTVLQKATHFVVKNLWYNNGRWYRVVEGKKVTKNTKISRNHDLTSLFVGNATAWLQNTKHKIVKGDTVLFDYIFYIHPTAIGHWCEMLFPFFSVLKELGKNGTDMNIVLLHLKRKHLMEWVRSVMATAFGVEPGDPLPPLWLQRDKESPLGQTATPLEGIPADTWVWHIHPSPRNKTKKVPNFSYPVKACVQWQCNQIH